MYFAGFGYIQHFLVLISKSTVIIAEYCFSSSISAADYTYGEKAACYVQNKFNCWIYTTYFLVYVNKGAAPMNLREMLAISRGNWMADTIFYCIYPNARSAAGRMENHLTFFYIFAIFSLFRKAAVLCSGSSGIFVHFGRQCRSCPVLPEALLPCRSAEEKNIKI